jgi:hypothetical protein
VSFSFRFLAGCCEKTREGLTKQRMTTERKAFCMIFLLDERSYCMRG